MATRILSSLLATAVLSLCLVASGTAQEISPTPTPTISDAAPMIVEPVADAGQTDNAVEPAAAETLTRPTLVDTSHISAGDTAWVMTSTALVLFMTLPGLALFYAGMVRKKNVLATMAHSFAVAALITVIWVVIGYSLAFTPGSPYVGSLDRILLSGMEFLNEGGKLTVSEIAPTIPESVFVMFQMTFAIITAALITGAFAERMKFSALLIFMALWSVCVYAPVAHWVWEPGGWLAGRGVLDFAGGTVVHINAGVSGLVAAIIVGPRLGFGREPMPPHNLVLTVIGACMLWVGWFGFNAGSAVAADGRAGMAMLVTQLATAVGALAWMLAEWARRGKPSVLGMVSGAVSGLVAITPASGFVGINGALVIGAVAGVACYWGATSLKSALGYDDSLDVFGVHAIGGIVGALLTGVFAVPAIGGATSSFGNQAFGVIVTVVFSGVMTAVILGIVKALVGLRVTPEGEREGMDIEQHGEHVL
ncbi:ammonium transporter [Oxalicibacterium flavum]|uniref:Ammonium transporter n=1 Tax=Oxalicibacterium flavum TaxID=179467 RepID=A0A8J2UK05_9BURK|nr:ammonium transporter [Oxalicibacterium flavum]GGB97915.1 ammonium transporter [Oxalicibacterium flavum]